MTVPLQSNAEAAEELMRADYVQLSWNAASGDVLPAGAYIMWNGEKYSLLDPYEPEQSDELQRVYTPQFQSRVMGWGKIPFFHYNVNTATNEVLSKEPDWSLTGTGSILMQSVIDAIGRETGELWSIEVDESLNNGTQTVSFESTDIFSGLNVIASAFEAEWWADKTKTGGESGVIGSHGTIYLARRIALGEPVALTVGDNVGVPSVTESKEGYYNRFFIFGSTRNVTQDFDGANVNTLVNKRLTLDPVKYPDSCIDMRIDKDHEPALTKFLVFDDIYPRAHLKISDAANGLRARTMYRLNGDTQEPIQLGTDANGKPIYDQYVIWYFRPVVSDTGKEFSIANPTYYNPKTNPTGDLIPGKNLSVHFNSGMLNGREFELHYVDKDDTIQGQSIPEYGLYTPDFPVYKGDFEIKITEEGSMIIPTGSEGGVSPTEGDQLTLFNLRMPVEYTASSQKDLEDAANDTITERYTADLNNYTLQSNPVAFHADDPNLTVGRAVTYINGDYSYTTRVIRIVRKLDSPKLCEQEITIGSEKIKGTTQTLKEDVVIANRNIEVLAALNSLTDSITQQYMRTQQSMLEGFRRISDMWRFDPDDPNTIYSKYNVYSLKSVTAKGRYSGDGSDGSGGGGSLFGLMREWPTANPGNATTDALGANLGWELRQSVITLQNAGYATQTWVQQQGYLTQHQTLYELTVQRNGVTVGTYTPNAAAKTIDITDVASAAALTSHISNTVVHITAAERTKWNKTSTDLSAILGTDSDTIINKWEEVIAFLATYTEADTLANLLSNKADKATTLAGYGITDAYTKTQMDGRYARLQSPNDLVFASNEVTFVGGMNIDRVIHLNYRLADTTAGKITVYEMMDGHAGHAAVRARQLMANVANGTAPLVVSSTTLVSNLNADLLDGYHSSSFPVNKTAYCNGTSIYDLRFNVGSYDRNDFPSGQYYAEYPSPYGVYLSLAPRDKNSSALIFIDSGINSVSADAGHVFINTRKAGDSNTTYGGWKKLAFITDTVANASSLGGIAASEYLTKSNYAAILDTRYLTKATFDDLFEKKNIGTAAAPVWVIHAKYGLYSDYSITAKGEYTGGAGGTGGGNSYGRLDSWDAYVAGSGDVLSADLGYGLHTGLNMLTAKVNAIKGLDAGIVSAGTYTKVTTDTYGRVVAGSTLTVADIPALPWSKITSGKPTTLAGYGIADGLIFTVYPNYVAARFATTALAQKAADTYIELWQSPAGWFNLKAGKFITDGGTASMFVKGDGSLDTTAYATAASLDNYVTRSTTQEITGKKTFKNYSVYVQHRDVSTGGSALGLVILNQAGSTNGGVGTLMGSNNTFRYTYLGWGSSPWSSSTCLAIADSLFQYKGNNVLHAGNYSSILDSRYYTESEINTKLTNGSVTKLGTSTIGSSIKPIYLSGGVPTACSYAFGNGSGNAALNNGTLNTNLNADLLDGWHAAGQTGRVLKKSGYVSSATSGLSSYWGKLATINVTSNENKDIALYLHSAYSNLYGTLNINIRINSGGESYTLRMLDGNIPVDRIRLYKAASAPRVFELWVNVATQYGVINAVVLSETDRVGTEAGTWVTMHTTSFTNVQTPTLATYITPTYTSLMNNVASATRLQTPRTLWGQSFDGTGNVSGALTGVTDITMTGAVTSGSVKFGRNGSVMELLSGNNEFVLSMGGSYAAAYINYRTSTYGGRAPAKWVWNAGTPTTYADFDLGALNVRGDLTLAVGKQLKSGTGAIEWDASKGMWKFTGGIYSDGPVTAKGSYSGSGSAGGGNAYGRYDDATWTSVPAAEDVLAATLGVQLNNRVKTLEGKNYLDALTMVQSGSGNAVTSVTLSADKKIITVTKGNHVDVASAQTIAGAKTFSNAITIATTSDAKLVLNNTDNEESWSYISFCQKGTEVGTLGFKGVSQDLRWNTNKILHAGNYAAILDGRYVNVAGDTMTGALTVPRINASGTLVLNGGSGLYLRYADKDATSLVLSSVAFKPLDAANGVFSLGSASSRWTTLYANSINVTSTALVSNLNADLLDGYHRSNLYATVNDWFGAVGLTKSITVTGDKDTYYPVRITVSLSKCLPTRISVWKNLGSTTPSGISGNHSTGTSSMWMIFESRAGGNFWDGNGSYLRTIHKNMPYANLVGGVEVNGSAHQSFIIWLRGGTCQYYISCTNAFDVDVFYSTTNATESASYPKNVSPITSILNDGIVNTGYSFYGNATSAAKLQTARTINGTSFDGTANITTASWGTARSIGIVNSDGTGTAVATSVNGSANINLKLPATIKAALTGNATTATKLATARTINGTSFDGSANITTSYWGTARNVYVQDHTGSHVGGAVSVNGSAAVRLKLPSVMDLATLNVTTAVWLNGTSAMLRGKGKYGGFNLYAGYSVVANEIFRIDGESPDGAFACNIMKSDISGNVAFGPSNVDAAYRMLVKGNAKIDGDLTIEDRKKLIFKYDMGDIVIRADDDAENTYLMVECGDGGVEIDGTLQVSALVIGNAIITYNKTTNMLEVTRGIASHGAITAKEKR